jgi:hypothetical protein
MDKKKRLILEPNAILTLIIISNTIILKTKSVFFFRLMKSSLDGDIIRTQKLSLIIRTVGRHFPGHLLAWDFVKENWNKLVHK